MELLGPQACMLPIEPPLLVSLPSQEEFLLQTIVVLYFYRMFYDAENLPLNLNFLATCVAACVDPEWAFFKMVQNLMTGKEDKVIAPPASYLALKHFHLIEQRPLI